MGGNLVFSGKYDDLINKSDSVTAKCLKNEIQVKKTYRKAKGYLPLKNVSINNLKNVSIEVPLGVLCSFTGVSGSGKSSLLVDGFAKKYSDKVITVDQSPMQGMARGNCATYIGVFDKIRKMMAEQNNVSLQLFSFNGKGACMECKGLGYKKIDMHFMGDVKVKCETCLERRYKDEVLQYTINGKNMAEILQMTVDEAYVFFDDVVIKKQLGMLKSVGLSYIELGQSHDTFSGGEAQRLKLAKQLQKRGNIYVLDEPTAGLHMADIDNLLVLLNNIVDNGNTVLAVEHDLKFIANSDWIIDIGPEGGDRGGTIIGIGTPIDLMRVKGSYTGEALKIGYKK